MIRDQRKSKINFDDDFVRVVIAGRPRAERVGGGSYIFKPAD